MKNSLIFILILLAQPSISAHAKLESNGAKVAENSHIECLAGFLDHMKEKGMHPDNVPDGYFRSWFEQCKKSGPLAYNLLEKYRAAGFKNPEKEVARLILADPSERAAKLKKSGIKLPSAEVTATLDDLGLYRAALNRSANAQSAQLIPPVSAPADGQK